MRNQERKPEALEVKEATEVRVPVKRMQFKTLGALREMQERIRNSKILATEEQEKLDELLNNVRERWIKINT